MFADRDGNRSQRLLLLRCIAIGAVITGIIATGSSAIATVGVVTVAVSGIIATITAVATALTGILRFLGLIRRGLLGVLLGARSHGGLLLSSPGLLRAVPHVPSGPPTLPLSVASGNVSFGVSASACFMYSVKRCTG